LIIAGIKHHHNAMACLLSAQEIIDLEEGGRDDAHARRPADPADKTETDVLPKGYLLGECSSAMERTARWREGVSCRVE